jgi:hypothetical protein
LGGAGLPQNLRDAGANVFDRWAVWHPALLRERQFDTGRHNSYRCAHCRFTAAHCGPIVSNFYEQPEQPEPAPCQALLHVNFKSSIASKPATTAPNE